MSQHSKTDSKQLETFIANAMKKVGAKKENDICRYLPGEKGGYIHHFSMRKLKHEDPDFLSNLISKHIINPHNPGKLPPKPRAPRGSRKRRDIPSLSRQDIERLLLLAHKSGDSEIVRKLAPRKDLRTAKRELIASIKHNQLREELWLNFVEVVRYSQQTAPVSALIQT